MKKIKRVLLALCGLSLMCLAGCKKDADYIENAVQVNDVCDKSEMAGLKKAAASEEDLIKVFEASVKETDDFMKKNNPDRSVTNPNTEAKTVDEAITQMVDYINELVKQVNVTVKGILGDKELKDFEEFSEFELLELLNKNITFSFDKDINVGNIKVSEWIDAIGEALVELNKGIFDAIEDEYDESDLFNKEDIKQLIIDSIQIDDFTGKEAVENADAYLAILDDFIIVNKFYLGTKINVNLKLSDLMNGTFSAGDFDINGIKDLLNKDEKKNESSDPVSIVNADISSEVAVALKNVNKFISALSGVQDADLPLKGISVYSDATVDVDLLDSDVSKWVTYFMSPKLQNPTINKAKVTGTQQVAMAVCTAEGEGGYITFTVKEDADAGKVMDVIQTAYEDSGDKLKENMTRYCDEIITVKVVVTNGKKKTFEKEYKLSEFDKVFGDYFKIEDETIDFFDKLF